MSKQTGKTFEYGGYHFTPYRQFGKKEGDFFVLSRRLEIDRDMGLSAYPERQKFPYVYKDFYAASTDKTCDIFRCEENGRVYVPGERELFLYHEPPNMQRPSVTSRLAKAQESVSKAKPVKGMDHGGPEL